MPAKSLAGQCDQTRGGQVGDGGREMGVGSWGMRWRERYSVKREGERAIGGGGVALRVRVGGEGSTVLYCTA